MKSVLILIGTRPEAIKMAPVVLQLQKSRDLRPVVCATGQHREMLASALEDFGIVPDADLALMTPGQTLNGLAGRLFLSMERMVGEYDPACLLVQGDTTTAMIGAVSGFYQRIPVGHVEAGLRSHDMSAPYPEEFNRRAAALAASWHFAPTQGAKDNLLREGIAPEQVLITGNTIVDALMRMRRHILDAPPRLPEEAERILHAGTPYVLITGHRRENFGQGMESLCEAIRILAERHRDHAFIYPVHLNPRVHDVVHARLGGFSNVVLIPPCGYTPFLRLLDSSLFIISDSGGIQEEAPSFGKQVLVTREVTERPEGVEAGVCHLVGTDTQTIIDRAESLFAMRGENMSVPNPYGDGKAAERIVAFLEEKLEERHDQ